MKLSFLFVLGFFTLSAFGGPTPTAMRPGLWKFTYTTTIDGEEINLMDKLSQMKKELAQAQNNDMETPPEINSEISSEINSELAKELAQSFNIDNATHQCLTKDDLKDYSRDNVEKFQREFKQNCKITNSQTKKERSTHEYTCDGNKASIESVMKDNEYEIIMNFDSTDDDGKKSNHKVVTRGKWIQKDCPQKTI